VLKASTDLYYEAPAAGRAAAEGKYRPTNREILVLNGVSRDFGGIAAVADLSVSLREQEILAVIGPNGAGKTTVFNLISGIYPPTGGVITFGGVEISGKRPPAIARLGILRTFQNIRLFNHMSVLDNVRVGRFCRMTDGFFSILFNTAKHRAEEAETDRLAREYLQLFGKRLTGYRYDQEALFLSYANRRRLEIARALGAGARVLLLDEPAAGMNPQETAEITGFIKRLRDDFGYTILLIEHKLGVVRNVSDRVIVLDAGEKIAEGDFDQIACDQCVIESYLGRKRS
jgi:ABC-type branched-subunit amino acid transport system ATPase component